MTKGVYELKPEELRAVIGGAVSYGTVNKLPSGLSLLALDKAPEPRRRFDSPGDR